MQQIPELQSWLDNKSPPKVLWINGLPGVGKSVLAAQLIRTLLSETSPKYLCYFFCKDGEQQLMHAQNIIQTFSYQLAQHDETFLRELYSARVVEKFIVSSAVGIRLLYNRIIERPLSVSVSVTHLYCVIDGLDEGNFQIKYGRSGDPELIEVLKLLAMTPKIRLLVISRRIPQIQKAFVNLEHLIREIDSADNAPDIELYIS